MTKKNMADELTTYESWIDALGNEIRPGDTVAIAIISGRSPQLVTGKIISINAYNSRGVRHVDTRFVYKDGRIADRKYVETCTITVEPTSGSRWAAERGDRRTAKKITYNFPDNMVKIADGAVIVPQPAREIEKPEHVY